MADSLSCTWTGASGKKYIYEIHERHPKLAPNEAGNYIYAKMDEHRRWVPIYIGEGNLTQRAAVAPRYVDLPCRMSLIAEVTATASPPRWSAHGRPLSTCRRRPCTRPALSQTPCGPAQPEARSRTRGRASVLLRIAIRGSPSACSYPHGGADKPSLSTIGTNRLLNLAPRLPKRSAAVAQSGYATGSGAALAPRSPPHLPNA